MSNNFVYTPRIATTGQEAVLADEPKTIDFDVISEFDSVNDIIESVIQGLPLHSRKDPETGEAPKSVATILFGTTRWENIEELRRSDEWHDACNAYAESHEGIRTEKLTLPKNGRRRNATNGSNKIKLTAELPEGFTVDDSVEDPIEHKVGNPTKNNVVTVTAKVKVREYTTAERRSYKTNAELLAELEQKEAEIAELKANDTNS